MSFEILIHNDLSLADLIKVSKEGGVVLKTPHVGNIYPNNLLIASLGIPTLFYDRTLGIKDSNFHPDKIIFSGRCESIADPHILTTHARVTHIPDIPSTLLEKENITVGTSLVDLHMSAVRRTLPQAHCFTYTEYIQTNKDQVLQVLEKVTELHPNLWSRTVNEEGETLKSQARDWNNVLKEGIFGLTNMKSGWIIPNPISVLFHGTVDAAKAKVKDVYLLSGPDMYRYIDGYQIGLNEAYDYIRKTLGWDLPETIHCHIIPVIGMRFIIEVGYRDTMDNLVNLYFKHVSVEKSIRAQATQKADIQSLIHKKNIIKNEIYSCLKSELEAFKTTMFYDIEDANCFTQYDLLDSRGLYVHPWAVNSRLSDVLKAYNFLSGCYSYVEDKLQDEL